MSFAKTRLDDYLVQAGFALDQKEAQALILSGEVRLKGNPAKSGSMVGNPADVNFRPKSAYVSRGGEKLRGALHAFGIAVEGKTCTDVGSSTGGFTHCLLQHGAKEVFAIDVGKGLIDQQLREDARVHLFEGVNFRHFDPALLKGQKPQMAVVDVSFISVTKILEKLRELLVPDAAALVLVKPQFEATPKEAPAGVVKDEAVRQEILNRTRPAFVQTGFDVLGTQDSVLTGRSGNRETFFLLKRD
jgi:23S rRNA (cytidine1920-2'-O)/16S rRNA (cytidine1409-2'-O)-methyltransferase